MRAHVLLLAVLTACRSGDDTTETGTPVVDEDGDGVAAEDDCNDADAAVRPGADELCNGIDDDCDGTVDDGATDVSTFYADADDDGYGTTTTTTACDAPPGYASQPGDCNDSAADVHPGADEADCADPTDYNCDGSTGYTDADGDGHAACEDCDDAAATVHEGAVEICNGVDDDCDAATDEEGAVGGGTFYADADADGFGDPSTSQTACAAPSGWVDNDDDCADDAAAVHPGADELCNALDDDCDGASDEGAVDVATWYADADDDGHGAASKTLTACSAPTGYVASSDDCDDLDAAKKPGATEICDGKDNDCSGGLPSDEADADADGQRACAGDCDDTDAAVAQGKAEICDGKDNDCDGDADKGATDAPTWHVDGDGDGFGGASTSKACAQPTGFVDDDTDCDDGDAAVNPDAEEVCDGDDNDCADGVDEDEDVLGSAETCAAKTCADLLDRRPAAASGPYFLDPDGGAALTAYCDMTTDGGGWTQIQYTKVDQSPEGYNRDYAAVFSSKVRGAIGSGSYKIAGSRFVATATELRYSEPADPQRADSRNDAWKYDFACGLTPTALDKIKSPGFANQVPAAVTCTNLGTGATSPNAKLLNYQGWSSCWTGPRLWIGSSATPGEYHGDYCTDCVVTWKCDDGSNGVYSVPSTTAGAAKPGSVAFWLR